MIALQTYYSTLPLQPVRRTWALHLQALPEGSGIWKTLFQNLPFEGFGIKLLFTVTTAHRTFPFSCLQTLLYCNNSQGLHHTRVYRPRDGGKFVVTDSVTQSNALHA